MMNASNCMDSSVMISTVNLYNLAYLGIMLIRMNSDGVNMVCMYMHACLCTVCTVCRLINLTSAECLLLLLCNKFLDV